MKNWKTTIAGITAILTGISGMISGGASLEAISAITAGIGLIFAKDKNVTGGNIRQ